VIISVLYLLVRCLLGLWVPKTYATRRYSWMTPPAVKPLEPEVVQVGEAI
jgi:hypothetical protein